MNRHWRAAARLSAALLAGAAPAFAHGGVFRPPSPSAGSGPAPTPAPSAPMRPVVRGPSAPAAPSPPSPGTPLPPSLPAGAPPSTGIEEQGDYSNWAVWWNFNKDPYLELKRAIEGTTETGSDDAFVDPRLHAAKRPTARPGLAKVRAQVVPALEAAIEKERNGDVVTAVLIALARIGADDPETASRARPRILHHLRDPVQEIAETATVALGILGGESSVELLAALLADDKRGRELVGSGAVNDRTRAFAAYGLGLAGSSARTNRTRQHVGRSLTDLIAHDADSAADVEVAAVITLGMVPIDVEEDAAVESALTWTSRQGQVRFLAGLLDDRGVRGRRKIVRAHVPTALARLSAGLSESAAEEIARRALALIREGGKSSNEVLQSAVAALGLLGDSDREKLDLEIRAQLKRVADGPDQQARAFALIALGQIGARPGRGDGNEFGANECRNFLLDQLVRGKSRMRTWAAIALGVQERGLIDTGGSGSATVRETLRAALADGGSGETIGAYAIGAGLCRDADAASVLSRRLSSVSDESARGYLCVALGMIGARDAIPAIGKIARDSRYRPVLLREASIALGLLGDKDIGPELVKMLAQAQGQSAQASIASALGYIGDGRSVEPLVAMLARKDITDSARAFAAVALGIVCDKEPLPWTSRISRDLNYRANTPTLLGGNGTGVLEIL